MRASNSAAFQPLVVKLVLVASELAWAQSIAGPAAPPEEDAHWWAGFGDAT